MSNYYGDLGYAEPGSGAYHDQNGYEVVNSDMAHVDPSNSGNRQKDFGARIQRLRDAKDNQMMKNVEDCAVNEGRSTKVMLLGIFLCITTVTMLVIAWLPYWVYGGNDFWMGYENHGGLINVFVDKNNGMSVKNALAALASWAGKKSDNVNSVNNFFAETESMFLGHTTYIAIVPKVCSLNDANFLGVAKFTSGTCNAARMMLWAGLFMLIAIVGCSVANVISVVYLWLGQRWHKVQYIKLSQIVLTIGTAVLFVAFILLFIFSFQWYKFGNFGIAVGLSTANYIPWNTCMYIQMVMMILQVAATIMAWMMPVHKIAGVNAIMEGMCADDGSYGATEESGYYDPQQQDYGYNQQQEQGYGY